MTELRSPILTRQPVRPFEVASRFLQTRIVPKMRFWRPTPQQDQAPRIRRQYQTYLKVRGRWCYLYRAIDRDGNLVDTMLSEHRDMAAAKAFFRSAKAATGVAPDLVTTDGHGSYPRAIRTTLGRHVVHRTSAYKNNRLEQDHRGVKGRIRCMRGFKSFASAERFCRSHDELRNFLRLRTRHDQHIPADRRRLLHLRRATAALAILEAA
jgi:putative transposase